MLKKPEKRERSFQSGLTSELQMVASICLFICIAFIVVAGGLEKYFGKGGTLFLILAGVVFVGLGGWMYLNTGKALTITPKEVIYRDRWTMLTLAFKDLAYFEEPGPEAKRFIRAHLSDGTRGFYIDSVTFKDFALIVSLIRMARKARYHSDSNIYLVGGD